METYDPLDLDTTSRLSSRVPHDMRAHRYELLDTSLLGAGPFKEPITRICTLRLSQMYLCLINDRFATRIEIGGDGLDRFCLSVPLGGVMELTQTNHRRTTASGSRGLTMRGAPGTQLVTSDGASRMNLWIEARALVGTLEEILEGRLTAPLEFRTEVDWTKGLALGIRAHMEYLLGTMSHVNGASSGTELVTSPSFSDMLIRCVLHALPHNYSERMGRLRSTIAPAHVSRAEAFMQANATGPIRMADVAAAAGCSTRSLSLAFQRFRDTTPLSVLHAIRLDHVRELLRTQRAELTVTEAAKCYRFTSPARFRAAYQRRFGELPSATAAGPKLVWPNNPGSI